MLNVLLVSTSSLKRFPVCLAVVASCLRSWFVSLLCISVCVYMCVYVYCVYYVGVLVVPSFVVVYVLGMGRERHSGGLGESEKMLKEEYRSLEID